MIDQQRLSSGTNKRANTSTLEEVEYFPLYSGVLYQSVGSDPVYNIDVPEVSSVSIPVCEFIYNFYVNDERVEKSPRFEYASPDGDFIKSLDKFPRYVRVSWGAPNLSDFQLSQIDIAERKTSGRSIKDNDSLIVLEDDMPSFITDTFSSVSEIIQGSEDLENYSYLTLDDSESVAKMATNVLREQSYRAIDELDPVLLDQILDLTDAYRDLTNYPNTSLGMSVFNASGDNSLERDSQKNEKISQTLKLNCKINSSVLADLYVNSPIKKSPQGISSLNKAIASAKSNFGMSDMRIIPVARPPIVDSVTTVKLLGYKVERYRCKRNGEKIKDGTFFVEDPTQTSFVDTSVAYGNTYLYSIRTIASAVLYPLEIVDNKPKACFPVEVYVGSKPTYTSAECHEYRPPPPPVDINFSYDRNQGNLVIFWSMPVNPQKDITQFQVFRRKSIKDPFELISQYHFDKSIPGGDFNSLFTTGEYVDSNNPFLDQTWADFLTTKYEFPIYQHRDEDFVVDSEFFQTQPYIYAICSIDAHGMISNYSSQYLVDFDPYKNQLVRTLVCDPGSPRQYPNMFLRSDAFKDVIKVSGVDTKKLKIAFTPEYFNLYKNPKVKRSTAIDTHKIVEAKTKRRKDKPHYLLQIINLDNQKMQTVRIDVNDPEGITEVDR